MSRQSLRALEHISSLYESTGPKVKRSEDGGGDRPAKKSAVGAQPAAPPWDPAFSNLYLVAEDGRLYNPDPRPIGDYTEDTGRYQRWATEEAERYQIYPEPGLSVDQAIVRSGVEHIIPPNATREEKEIAFHVWE